MPHRPQHSGFTFVEILVVMCIVVVLAGLAYGPGRERVQQRKLAECAENLRKLHLTLSLYANEHDGAFPNGEGARDSDAALSVLVPRYSSDRSFFSCPATGHSGRVDYAYVAGLRRGAGPVLIASDARCEADAASRGVKILTSVDGNHGKVGGNLLFTDGHIEAADTTKPRTFFLPPGARLISPSG